MNLHEYQAKNLLKQYDLPTPIGVVAGDAAAAVAAAKNIESNAYVVKAQIHAGGRGKAGGVKLVKSLAEVEAYANNLLGRAVSSALHLARKISLPPRCVTAAIWVRTSSTALT